MWVQRLKWVFNIDIETCPKCGGAVRVIEDPVVIDKILTPLGKKAALNELVVFASIPNATAIGAVRMNFRTFPSPRFNRLQPLRSQQGPRFARS